MTGIGITGDTDPENPVHNYPADVFPLGAALTIAYGSNERPLCTLGNLYRIVGYLTGDIPIVDGDPDAEPPLPSLNDEIARCAEHVTGQLPDELRTLDPPPPADAGAAADHAWLAGVMNKYGATIPLVALPGTINNPTPTLLDEGPTPDERTRADNP